MQISYNGKTIETKHYIEITEEERSRLHDIFYTKPPFSDVEKNIKRLAGSGVRTTDITKYYFKDLLAKTQVSTARWTVEDVFNSKELLGIFKEKITTNDKVFPPTRPEEENIEAAIRLGGKSYAQMPAQFPYKNALEVVKKYNINNNFYDFSCGWGGRLLAALHENINYFGTDPNYILVERLNQLASDWKKVIKTNTSIIDIRSQGSEFFIPEWEDQIGLALSSPPYYNLEDYKIGEQSYAEGRTYEMWLNQYMNPTINNIHSYLITNGILAFNIKDLSDYPLTKDCRDIIESCGFRLIDTMFVDHRQRIRRNGEYYDNSECIYIYQKI